MSDREYPLVFLELILFRQDASLIVSKEKLFYFFDDRLLIRNRNTIQSRDYLWIYANELWFLTHGSNIDVLKTLCPFLRLDRLHLSTIIIQSAALHKHNPLEKIFYQSWAMLNMTGVAIYRQPQYLYKPKFSD